ncbi:hypothetical protein CC80DRAFT_411666, partial [Byssothecium circinans]
AVENGHEVVVKLLLKTSKVNVNLKDYIGKTLLYHVVENGHEVVVKLLLKTSKVNINAKD